jgi:deoxyribonuclease V
MPDLFIEPPDLTELLKQLLAQIPRGRVATYGGLAEALGNPIAARWVGHFMLHHAHHAGCPCHRVVRVDGQLGLYVGGDAAAKARRLAVEGITVRDGRVDLTQQGFEGFKSDRPLERLRAVQDAVARRVSLRRRTRLPDLLGGVDVSYPSENEAVGAFALVDLRAGELVWSTTVRRRVVFPYISSYLTFRELPVLLDLVRAVRRAGFLRGRGEPVLVDGSGILHPRHVGIASHFGVAAGLPTVGVTKKLLVGQVAIDGLRPRQSRPVVHDGRVIGAAVRPTSGSRRPIFVSPGHRVDVEFAERLVRLSLLGRRLPEPLYWADRLSREAGRAGTAQ